MTLLCSDKTGTLTLNTMVIQVIPAPLLFKMRKAPACRLWAFYMQLESTPLVSVSALTASSGSPPRMLV